MISEKSARRNLVPMATKLKGTAGASPSEPHGRATTIPAEVYRRFVLSSFRLEYASEVRASLLRSKFRLPSCSNPLAFQQPAFPIQPARKTTQTVMRGQSAMARHQYGDRVRPARAANRAD